MELAVLIIVYALFSICLIYPPTEFLSAGLTLEAIFARFLGDEAITFVDYHIRRSCLTAFAHSCLPLGLCLLLKYADIDTEDGDSILRYGLTTNTILAGAVLLPILAATLIYYWSRDDWRQHPAARTLSLYDSNWRNVASAIETEYRRIDKFSITLGGVKRIVVTDSWILFVDLYRLKISNLADARLTVVGADEHRLTEGAVQFVTIQVENITKPIPQFSFRLNSLSYRDLKNKVQAPIETARGVIIHMSLDERFVQAFQQLAESNPSHEMSEAQKDALEPCIGCMQESANVKLEKSCVDSPVVEYDEDGQALPNCRQCYCRPMWCVACMGRWFASRQNARRPENWLSGKSPCPNCRATFCVLDVRLIK